MAEALDRHSIINTFHTVWKRTDFIFGELLTEEGLYQRPIALRNPLLFYLGHLPGFDYIQIVVRLLKEQSFNPKFDAMFERGIDPDVDDPTKCHSHSEIPDMWPPLSQIHDYIQKTKEAILQTIDKISALQEKDDLATKGRIYHLVWEHSHMHHETFFYMYHQLSKQYKKKPSNIPPPILGSQSVTKRLITIPGGNVIMGVNKNDVVFGWDNEFPAREVYVPEFSIDSTNVTVGEFLEFVMSGEYENEKYWRPDHYTWKQKENLHYPVFWKRHEDGSFYMQLVFGEEIPITEVLSWPVNVSLAEALAYAKWKGRSLPTEEQWMRAAYTAPHSTEMRQYPWGDEPPTPEHGNFNFQHYGCTPVNTHPKGASAWGVEDLIGDAWEWTSTVFQEHPGFEALPNYPGYSADFFDGKHYVLKGASWATDVKLVRRSFRNWYQDKYPYMYAKFRLVTNKE